MKSIVLILLTGLCLISTANAQQGSDIYLGQLRIGEAPKVSDLQAVTNNPAYTNQPYFFNASSLYFTQELKGEEAQNGQMDTFVYDLPSKSVRNVSQSSESEYSPTPTPDGNGLSVIRVNAEGKQELWQLGFSGEPLQHYVPAVEPVGYQVWMNEKELLLFVLGEPHTLQKVSIDKPNNKGAVVDDNIGASLYRVNNSDWFLYSRAAEKSELKAYHQKTGVKKVLAELPKGSQYFSVSANGNVVTSDGNSLYYTEVTLANDGDLSSEGEWSKITVEHAKCRSGVSRTAISPDGQTLALVCPH